MIFNVSGLFLNQVMQFCNKMVKVLYRFTILKIITHITIGGYYSFSHNTLLILWHNNDIFSTQFFKR